jgi:hypothetical protein
MGEASRRGTREERVAQAIARQKEANRLSRELIAQEAEERRQRVVSTQAETIGYRQALSEQRRRRVAVLGYGHSSIMAAALLVAAGYPVIGGDERKKETEPCRSTPTAQAAESL